MIVFPNLSIKPSGDLGEGPSKAADTADIRTPSEAGFVITRRRFTYVPKVFSFSYWPLSESDYAVLSEFVDDVGTTQSFEWAHPLTDEIYEVRFLKRPKFVYRGVHWATDIELESL